MDPPSSNETIQVGEKDLADLMELLDGYKTMLLAHEKRIGTIEALLAQTIAAPRKMPQDHRRKRT